MSASSNGRKQKRCAKGDSLSRREGLEREGSGRRFWAPVFFCLARASEHARRRLASSWRAPDPPAGLEVLARDPIAHAAAYSQV